MSFRFRKRINLAPCMLLILAGCATQPMDTAILAASKKPLTCSNKEECDSYWQRAQVYVRQNSTYPIQSVTDTVLTTDGPTYGSEGNAYHLTKVPNADGSATIEVQIACDNPLGCHPDRTIETVNLKRFVRESK
ncbi:MAG TPA: hypothetical protein VJT81_05440 [Burkholderiales bacterium]|nr:hypothetical protein [Burkholderiales bacterium]